MKNLSFDEATHTYTITDGDGAYQVPSVTQIAKSVTGKDMSAIPPAALKKARDRGLAIHEDVQDRSFQTPEGQWIKQQLGDIDFDSEVKESGVIDNIEYAGTCDILMENEIGDIKSEGEENLLYWKIQLNLYRILFPGRDNLFVLWVPKSGNFKRVPIEVLTDKQMTEVMAAFREHRTLPPTWPAEERPAPPNLDLIVTYDVGTLTTNAKAILEVVRNRCATYKAENYSETNIAEAKRDKAELNAAAKKFNDRRIELEREFMKPFADFKDVVGEICTEIKKASGLIDGVVKEVEEREKADKKKLITDYWNGLGCELFTLDQIWQQSWTNKTTKVKDVQAEIAAKVEKVKADLAVLDRIGEPGAKAYYLTTLDLESALAEADRIKANRALLAAAESAKSEAAPASTPAPSMTWPTRSEPSAVHVEKAEPMISSPEILVRTMRVWGTRAQIIALGDFMNANGIDFEKIEGGDL